MLTLLAQDLLAEFTNSANAAGQLNSQVNKEVASTTANIVGSAETAISDAVESANEIANQVCHLLYCLHQNCLSGMNATITHDSILQFLARL